MMREDDVKLVSELARIAERYGPGSVTRLASLIKDPESAADIAAVLEAAAGKAKAAKSKTRSKARSTDRIGMGVLSQLEETDPNKHSAVAEFRDRLLAGASLRSMQEIRQFALIHDLSIGKASSRNAAIPALLRSIAELETPAVLALLDSLTTPDNEDRSLKRWRELIVKPRDQQNIVAR